MDLPLENCDFHSYVSLPEGNQQKWYTYLAFKSQYSHSVYWKIDIGNLQKFHGQNLAEGVPFFTTTINREMQSIFSCEMSFLLPSGKHTKNYGKSPFFIGKSTINGPFSIAMLNYQMVYVVFFPEFLGPSHKVVAKLVCYAVLHLEVCIETDPIWCNYVILL